MVKFVPHDADFCYATVKGGSAHDKHQFVCSWLKRWLEYQVCLKVHGLVVFDIDNTLIDTEHQPINAVIELYAFAQSIGLMCAIVTARPETTENRDVTVAMLHTHKISGWESLYMIPSHYTISAEGVSIYKREARDDLESRHRILANIGDMWHDIVRIPVSGALRVLAPLRDETCAVLFPVMSHGEVAVKLAPSNANPSSKKTASLAHSNVSKCGRNRS
jgi:hypothetical protein